MSERDQGQLSLAVAPARSVRSRPPGRRERGKVWFDRMREAVAGDPEREILQLGFDTESTSGGKFRAMRGEFVTHWHSSWSEVLDEVCGKCF